MSTPEYIAVVERMLAEEAPFMFQLDLAGVPQIPAGQKPSKQIDDVMAFVWSKVVPDYPEAQDDEDLVSAIWLSEFKGWRGTISLANLWLTHQQDRKVDTRRVRQTLRYKYPYTDEEEERRRVRALSQPTW